MNPRVEKLIEYLKDAPKDCFLNHALALEYVKVDNDLDARKHFELNLENDPTYIATYYHFGKLLERAGDWDNAIIIYEKGMEKARAAKDMHTYNELQAAYEDLVY